MEKARFSFDKISEERRKKIEKKVEELRNEGSRDFSFEETPNDFVIGVQKADGKERKIHITKIGDKILIDGGDEYANFEDAIEASIRFPEDNLKEALRKTAKFKKE